MGGCVLLLLFTIGLELSLDRLKGMRRALAVGGGLQVSLATLVTTGVLLLAGVPGRRSRKRFYSFPRSGVWLPQSQGGVWVVCCSYCRR